jgi:membrane associated rhomboid family serine protease
MPPKDIALALVAGAFAVMGAGALLAPERVLRQFGVPALTPDGKNEVRAVYGGFGVAVCAVLLAAGGAPALRGGVCIAIAAALVGMIGGRLYSAAADRALGRAPLLYLAIEAFAAASLFYAA